MLELDGRDAGGQYVRTALALATLLGQSIRIDNIRGNRPKPGLSPQHLAAVETVAELTGATVEGGHLGSESLIYDPGDEPTVSGGSTRRDIGTAGSIALLFDVVIPLSVRLTSPLSVTVTGGTDVAWSPPIDYLTRVKLPLLRRHGIGISLEIHERGFYPAGGGSATVHLFPSDLDSIEMSDPPSSVSIRIISIETDDLRDRDVATRQADAAGTLLLDDNRIEAIIETTRSTVASLSTGSSALVIAESDDSKAGFDRLGEPGMAAEAVGERAAERCLDYLEHDAPVDVNLADQLLIYLAIGGGRLRIPEVTDHVETSMNLFRTFGLPISRSERTIEADPFL